MDEIRYRVNVLYSSTFIRQGPGERVYLSFHIDVSPAAAIIFTYLYT